MSCLINGKEYGWNHVKISLLGQTLTGVTGIKYEEKQKKENYLGAGAEPVSRGHGDKSYTCSVTLQMKEVEAIQRAIPRGKSFNDIDMFTIEVVYAPDGGVQVRDRILGCEFTGKGREVKAGDGIIEHEFELVVGKIEWNV